MKHIPQNDIFNDIQIGEQRIPFTTDNTDWVFRFHGLLHQLGFDDKTLRVSNSIAKKIHTIGKESDLVMGVRPEDFVLSSKEDEYGFPMEVLIVEELGPENIINLRSGDRMLKVLTDPDVRPDSGSTVWAVPDQDRIRIFDKSTQEEIL